MISETELLEVINEVHQYSMVLLELRDGSLYGIYRSRNSRINYFRVSPNHARQTNRNNLVEAIYKSKPFFLEDLTLDAFLSDLEGKTTRHIWLERKGREPSEMGFVGMKEVTNYLKSHPP